MTPSSLPRPPSPHDLHRAIMAAERAEQAAERSRLEAEAEQCATAAIRLDNGPKRCVRCGKVFTRRADESRPKFRRRKSCGLVCPGQRKDARSRKSTP